jgi:uncharacterized MAPEG superfamily protein
MAPELTNFNKHQILTNSGNLKMTTPIDTSILAPAAILALWSMIMLLWMAGTRFPAMAKHKDFIAKAPPGGRGVDLEKILPASVNWKAHNLNHLMEQPTVFYAVVGILAIVGQGGGLNAKLAWGYVALRIVHSIWQSTINTVPVRFGLFLISSICLIALCVHAVIATL